MAIFALTCATGAPGVTTAALGLTLAWPRDAVLVDADRCASQAILAGYLNGMRTGGRGLTSLAQSYRDGIDLVTDLPSHMVPFDRDEPGEQPNPSDHRMINRLTRATHSAIPAPPPTDRPPPKRWFLPGFARPGSSSLFEPVWAELAAALADLDHQGTDVILDAGRWGGRGLPAGVLAQARALVVVTRSSLRALSALRLYAPDIRAATAAESCSSGLLVVNPGAPYLAREISQQFGWPSWGEVPWQPVDAAALSDGAATRPRPTTRPLAKSFALLACALRADADHWDAQVTRTADPGSGRGGPTPAAPGEAARGLPAVSHG
jgi:hypothetical protein